MDITLDIETIPSQDPKVIDAIRKEVSANFKAPSSLTKEKACADLGMTDPKEIQFTSKDKALEMWAERFKADRSEEAVQEQYRKTSFDGALGQIAVIGVAFNDAEPITLYSEDYANDEARILRDFFSLIGDNYAPSTDRKPVFIGHYVTEFDLRFIFQRAVILGVKPHPIIPFAARPWDDNVYDTMTRWAGIKGSVKLDKLCGVLGIDGKGSELDGEAIDGSKVWDFVKAGRIADVAKYCAGDVKRARAVYKRLTFQISEDEPELLMF